MVSSVSRDLLNWDCAPKEFHVPPGDYYKQRRDPYVFWIPEMKMYGCVMTTWMKDSDWETGGALSLATSPDLKNWTDHGAIIYPGDMGSPECPQMFTLRGRWYALASIHQGQGEDGGVGQPTYWTSKSPLGPWAQKPTGVLDGKHLCAAQVAFNGETPLLFGWIPMTPSSPGKQKSWGGHLALPREIYALRDGSLGSCLSSNLLERFAKLPWQDVPDFTITSQPNTPDGEWEGEWHGFAAEFSLEMPATTEAVRMQIGTLGEVVVEHDRLGICDGSSRVISELAADIPSDRSVMVRIFVELDIIEVFVNDRYSLVARVPETTEDVWGDRDGTIAGDTKFVEGMIGDALEFDGKGSGDYVAFDVSGLPDGNAPRTMSLWLKPKGENIRVAFDYGSYVKAGRSGILLLPNNKVYFVGEYADVALNSTIEDSQWHYVTVTYDGTNIRIYINGALDIEQSVSLNTVLEVGRIGADVNSAWEFHGAIDEVSICDRALSADEVTQNYTAETVSQLVTDGLLSHWTFDAADIAGQTAMPLGFSMQSDGSGAKVVIGM